MELPGVHRRAIGGPREEAAAPGVLVPVPVCPPGVVGGRRGVICRAYVGALLQPGEAEDPADPADPGDRGILTIRVTLSLSVLLIVCPHRFVSTSVSTSVYKSFPVCSTSCLSSSLRLYVRLYVRL